MSERTATVTERLVRGIVGESADRVDGVPKVQGAFEFGSDLHAEGMLWGATLRSPHPSARILSIDVSGALGSPGVKAVLTSQDVPGKQTFGLEFSDQPVLARDLVRYEGEPVAVVAAEEPEQARRALGQVVVGYEVLVPLADMEEALRPDAPKVHEFGNVLRHVHIERGDPEAEAEVWVEGYYESGMQDNAPLGPEGGLAIPAADGGVDLHVTTQWLHVDRQQIAPCLDLPEDKVRITLSGMGGAFGAREDIHLQIHACMLALATGRPVKMTYDREESFHGHIHRHPSRLWLSHGASRDGRLVTVRARLLIDAGAYSSSSPAVLANASTFAAGPYEVPNVVVDGTAVYTNNPPCGAMRGFGAPQVCFGYESQMDRLAAELGIDPVELRLRNAVSTGSVLPTGQVIRGSAPLREVIERCRGLPMPEEPPRVGREPLSYPGGAGNVGRGEGLRRGVGFAVGFKNIAYSEGFDDSAEARVTLSRAEDGPAARIHTASVEVGQGLYTVLAQIARTELGVEEVTFHAVDTGVGSAGSSSASRQTVMSGGAVQAACRSVAEELFARVRTRTPGAPEPLRVEGGMVLAGDDLLGPIEELLDEPIEATEVYHHRRTEQFDDKGQGDIHVMFAFAAERAVVDVDVDLGLVRVVQLGAVVDVGKVINPRGLEGQIEGGSAMGMGLAVMEEIQLDGGKMRNASFTDYLLPTILDAPEVVSDVVEEPEPDTPFGAKGVGESTTIVVTPAVVAAIRAATSRELNRVPVRPEDIVGLRPTAASGPPPPPPDVPWQVAIPELEGLGLGQQQLMEGG